MKTLFTIAGMFVLLASSADARGYDPMRCEALKLQRESKFHQCMSNCERKVLKREGFDAAACDEGCRTRYDRAVLRLEKRRACTPPSGDPHQCEAQALKVEARHLVCEAGCERKGVRPEFNVTECKVACDDWCTNTLNEVLSGPICDDGRAGVEQIDSEQNEEADSE